MVKKKRACEINLLSLLLLFVNWIRVKKAIKSPLTYLLAFAYTLGLRSFMEIHIFIEPMKNLESNGR